MNYQKIYNNIIENTKNKNRSKKDGNYYEKHHIVPKCLGGSNDINNLILLTAREHFLCHMLLCRIYPDNGKIGYSAFAMAIKCNQSDKRTYNISSRQFEEIKKLMKHNDETKKKISDHNKKYYSNLENRPFGDKNPNYRKDTWNKGKKGLYKHSEETLKKLSEAHKGKQTGENNGMYGKKHSEETRLKMSIDRKGRKVSEETRRKLSAVNTGRKLTEEQKEKFRGKNNGMYGKKASDYTKLKMKCGQLNFKIKKILNKCKKIKDNFNL